MNFWLREKMYLRSVRNWYIVVFASQNEIFITNIYFIKIYQSFSKSSKNPADRDKPLDFIIL